MSKAATFIRLSAIIFVLTGCEQVMHSIYREPTAGRDISVITDAKQRAIIRVGRETTETIPVAGKQPTIRRTSTSVVCAEPSPDVAQAISLALSAAANVERIAPTPTGSTGDDRKGTGVNFALASAAGVAQLGERIATIQLLRDKMYRACEAYANGAVGGTGYTLMLARLDKTMTTLLSNELAAGAFGRALAQIGTNSSATGGVSPKLFEEAEKEVKRASAALVAAVDGAAETQAAADLEKATTELLALERAVSAVAAGSSGATGNAGLGTIANGAGTRVVGDIADIHRSYLDDDGIEPLIDACITAMDVGDLTKGEALKQASAEFIAKYLPGIVARRTAAQSSLDNASEKLKEIEGLIAAEEARPVGQRANLPKFLDERKRRGEAKAKAEAELAAAQDALDMSYDDRVTHAYLAAGLTFPAFCHRAVFADKAPFIKARIDAKYKLRELEVRRIGISKEDSVCQSLMTDPKIRAFLLADEKTVVPAAARTALKTYCNIDLPKPAEPPKKT